MRKFIHNEFYTADIKRKSYKYTNQITITMSDVKLDHSLIETSNQSFQKVIKDLNAIGEATKSKEVHVQSLNAIEAVRGAQQSVANCINNAIKLEKEREASEAADKAIKETLNSGK